MTSARCPVCGDIFSAGNSIKLNQMILCPTCLTSLQVVALSPFELEIPEKKKTANEHFWKQSGKKKKSKSNGPGVANQILNMYDEQDEEEVFDDYTLERILRHKSERGKRREGEY